MDILNKHVDNLFRGYKDTKEIRELKSEILSNLQAKAADLTDEGMDYSDAVKKAKESIASIDSLINGNTKVYINKLKLEYHQILVIYTLAAWIFTIPLEVVGMGMVANFMFFILSIVLGITYFVRLTKVGSIYFDEEDWININSVCAVRKAVWVLWGLFIIASIFLVTGVQFGSNIWFSTPVRISGPYQFAVIILSYIIPMFSIIIPVVVNYAPKLVLKYEVYNGYEE